MKKTLFMLAVAGMAMAGCSNTDVLEDGVDQQMRKIGFESLVNKNTRALTNDNFKSFYVMGSYTTLTNTTPVRIFNNINVQKGDNGKWTYTEGGDRYWIKDARYEFHAYSLDNEKVEAFSFEAPNVELNNYVVNENSQKDFVYAYRGEVVGQQTGNKTVELEFKHALSKIHFTFTSEFPSGYTVIVNDVKVVNLRDKGNFTGGSTPTWSSQDREAAEHAIPLTLEKTTISGLADGSATGEIYVLPYTYTEANARLAFTLTVKNANGETVLQSVRRASFKPTWLMGYSYNYNVKLTGQEAGLEKIEFTTAPSMNLGNWGEGEDKNVEFTFGADVPQGGN